jgi:hypothetical protein
MKALLAVIAVVALSGCQQRGAPTSPTPGPGAGGTGRLAGAGDIAMCGSPGAELTARLLDGLDAAVFTAGDNAYVSGTAEEFQRCYDPAWGRHRGRTRPAPGNHDYGTPGAGPYFAYFGARAGEPGRGYYAYTLASWRIIVLNSEIDAGPGSEQARWLRSELASNQAACTLAIFHRPLFTSGVNGDNPDMREFWRALYDGGAEIVVNGHDHQYERLALLDPDGRPDARRGLRQFTVGTGGVPLYPLRAPRSFTEALGSAHGVILFTLEPGSYEWAFIPVEGAALFDSGFGACH